MKRRRDSGLSLVEVIVTLSLFLVMISGLVGLLVNNARINRSQKLTTEVQANARSCLSMVVQKLRSAGWDPMNAGINAVALDPIPTDNISQIEVFADLDMDSFTDSNGEQILIRHTNGEVEWRPSNDVSDPFRTIATNISNDADGDGTIEDMFVPDSTPTPTRITVRVTARSPAPDPVSGDFIRYTVSSDVVFRKLL